MALGRLSSKGRAALDSLAGYGSVFARRSRVGDWSDESSGAAGNRRIPSFRKERKTRPRGSIPVSGCPEAASRFSFVDRTSVLTIRKSKCRILAALGVVTLSASLIAIAMDHAIFAQYFGLLTSGGVLAELSPTLGGVFRLWFPQHQWVQALPAVLALLWFLFRWRKVRDGWQWREEMPILLLASLLTTSYGWFFDQIVLLPCVFQAAEWLTTSRRSISAGVAILYVCMNAMVLALILEHRTTFWYAWTVPAWCGLYGFCRVLG